MSSFTSHYNAADYVVTIGFVVSSFGQTDRKQVDKMIEKARKALGKGAEARVINVEEVRRRRISTARTI